eukprot:g9682.t2
MLFGDAAQPSAVRNIGLDRSLVPLPDLWWMNTLAALGLLCVKLPWNDEMVLAPKMLTVQVIALDGEVVLESLVPTTQTVFELKEAIWRQSKTWAPCWQRLIEDREILDTEVLGELYENQVVLQLVDAWRRSFYYYHEETQELRVRKPIARSPPEPGAIARQQKVIEAMEAMASQDLDQALQLIQRLFDAIEVEPGPWKTEDGHQVMNHLNAEDPGQFGKMMDVLRWLSPQIVPHLAPRLK